MSPPLAREGGSALRALQDDKHPARLFLLAFLTLYLELALIRYAAAEVLYLGYFANFILIAAFLGIGLGFLLAERRLDLLRFAPQMLLASVACVQFMRVDG